MNKLLDIAKSFDMNISELGKVMGCSRSNLHIIYSEGHKPQKKRLIKAINQLIILNDEVYKNDLEKVKRRKAEREKFIKYLIKLNADKEKQNVKALVE